MADEKKSEFVTRAELYPALGMAHTLIAFALLGHMRGEENTLLLIGHMLLFVVAVVSSFAFSILGIRERNRRKRDDATPDDGITGRSGE